MQEPEVLKRTLRSTIPLTKAATTYPSFTLLSTSLLKGPWFQDYMFPEIPSQQAAFITHLQVRLFPSAVFSLSYKATRLFWRFTLRFFLQLQMWRHVYDFCELHRKNPNLLLTLTPQAPSSFRMKATPLPAMSFQKQWRKSASLLFQRHAGQVLLLKMHLHGNK